MLDTELLAIVARVRLNEVDAFPVPTRLTPLKPGFVNVLFDTTAFETVPLSDCTSSPL